jgi:hypothetical protein
MNNRILEVNGIESIFPHYNTSTSFLDINGKLIKATWNLGSQIGFNKSIIAPAGGIHSSDQRARVNVVQQIKSALSGDSFVYIDALPDKQFKKHPKHQEIQAAISKQSQKCRSSRSF